MTRPNPVKQAARQEVAGLTLLELMYWLEQGAWGYQLRSHPQPDGTQLYGASVYGSDEFGGGKKCRVLNDPVAAMTEAYVDCVYRRSKKVSAAHAPAHLAREPLTSFHPDGPNIPATPEQP